ncbi:MAG: YicC family protein [Hyphomicrobiales bacterium]|nr:YicC family protein [Hyphomicrobiales bacterium]
MPLSSMTGFARSDGTAPGLTWSWELRSVNGKGLDIRLRLPPGLEYVEQRARERISGRLARGNCQVNLTVRRDASEPGLRVNEAALDAVVAAARVVAERTNAAPPSVDGLLAVRGVLETVEAEEDEEGRAATAEALLVGLDAALDELVAARLQEGEALRGVLATRIDEIERLTAAAEANPARTVEAIRARLADQVAALLDAAPQLDPQRLHQEAALLATRADIREELDRLTAHIAAARELLDKGGPVGRRLDFLAQEFNREVNTLCSKSNDTALTAIGLDLKAVVDQLREQIQNLE